MVELQFSTQTGSERISADHSGYPPRLEIKAIKYGAALSPVLRILPITTALDSHIGPRHQNGLLCPLSPRAVEWQEPEQSDHRSQKCKARRRSDRYGFHCCKSAAVERDASLLITLPRWNRRFSGSDRRAFPTADYCGPRATSAGRWLAATATNECFQLGRVGVTRTRDRVCDAQTRLGLDGARCVNRTDVEPDRKT